MMDVSRYTHADAANWDKFVDDSKNGTFLFKRAYMDYHADRFADHSLIVRDAKGNISAILPADEKAGVLRSHGGLTYGGLVTGQGMTTPRALEVTDAVIAYAREQGMSRIIYKTVPSIYHRLPAEEDRYALFLRGATLIRRDVLSVATQAERIGFQERRRRKIKDARKLSLVVRESDDLATYWGMLAENLQARHGVAPVHSLDEISLLRSRFPESIRLHACFDGPEMLAGVVMYLSPRVAHVQYICASEKGKEVGALDLLFAELLDDVYRSVPCFDFGISTEDDGRYLNTGLIEQKEGFGARAIMHDFYAIDLK
jgi:hypothetical protein